MSSEDEQAERALMERHGISRSPTGYYMVRGYRYFTLKEAVARVESDRAKPNKPE